MERKRNRRDLDVNVYKFMNCTAELSCGILLFGDKTVNSFTQVCLLH